MYILPKYFLLMILLVCSLLFPANTFASNISNNDWPQLQGGADRTGTAHQSIVAPYQARWIWLGPDNVLRNSASNSAWRDDLTSRNGYSFPMPERVAYTIAHSVQPVVASGRLFFGTQEGQAFALAADDGRTLWSADITGGTIATAATFGNTVVFVTMPGDIYALATDSGRLQWSYRTNKSLTGAPAIHNNSVYVVDHGGYVYALSLANGNLQWHTRLSAPVLGGLAIAENKVFVGSEDMNFYALNASTGQILATQQLRGQSFRFSHPVVHKGLVWVQTASAPAVGSEYIMEEVMRDSRNVNEEETNILRWLGGDSNNGRWSDASSDWQHLFAMRTSDLSKPFTVAAGPVEGCGMTAPAVVIDNQGRVLTWIKTRFPTLTGENAFGTNYALDLVAINQQTGKRIPIDNGRLSGMWMIETDNLYALSVAGNDVWLRQNFRGTQTLNLQSSTNRMVTNTIRDHDGAFYTSDVIYAQNPQAVPRTNQRPVMGRVAPAIAGNVVYITESFGITALESAVRTSAINVNNNYGVSEQTSINKSSVSNIEIANKSSVSVSNVSTEQLIWEFPEIRDISGADDLIVELREQIQLVLDRGSLAPLYLKYGDIIDELYYIYDEPGRIITTLAWAYPYVTAEQQTAIRAYVAEQLASPLFSPWAQQRLAVTQGARREYYPIESKWLMAPHEGLLRPRIQTYYGLWLYAYRSNDWQLLESYWSSITAGYQRMRSELELYGTVSGAIAVMRMAEQLGDNNTLRQTEQDVRQALQRAQNFQTFYNNGQRFYPEMYANRRSGELLSNWTFLNLSPEMGRFLRVNHYEASKRIVDNMNSQYPHWWLMQAPYFTRWTGDESIGFTPEIFGIMSPLQRYVLEDDAATMRPYLRSSPTGIGDSYWLEALAQTIEAHGSTNWVDVRNVAYRAPKLIADSPLEASIPPASLGPLVQNYTIVNQNVFVHVNEERMSFPDARPFIDGNNRTLIPVRFPAEAYEAQVDWEEASRTAIIELAERRIEIKIGQSHYTLNGQTHQMDTQAILHENRTYVPLRFISEALDVEVDWAAVGDGGIAVFTFTEAQSEQAKRAIIDNALSIIRGSNQQNGRTSGTQQPQQAPTNLISGEFNREQIINTRPGQEYTLTAWMRITADSGNDWGGIRMAAIDYKWELIASKSEIRARVYGNDWFQETVAFTAISDRTRIQIEYFGGPGNNMSFELRDVQVFERTTNIPPSLDANVRLDSTGVNNVLHYSLTASDSDGAVVAVEWDFGDGVRAFERQGQRAVTIPGTYQGRVRIADDAGAVASQDFTWTVADSAPLFTLQAPLASATVNVPSINIGGIVQRDLAELIISSDREQLLVITADSLRAQQNFNQQLLLEPGLNRILVQARDSQGRVSTVERLVTYRPSASPQFTIIQQASAVKKWDVAQIDFNISNMAATHQQLPFTAGKDIGMSWLDGVTVMAEFSHDNWRTIQQRPAFYQQPYQRQLRSNMEWLYPTSSSHWTVRFRPPNTGNWQYRLVIEDSRGTQRSTVQQFQVIAQDDSSNRGGLSVSQADSRYFEYQDGTSFLGGGFAIGPNAARYSYELAELFQKIGRETPSLLRLWIAGQLNGSAWQPWASRTLGYDATVPHTGLTLERAYGDGIASLRLDRNNPIMFQGFHTGRTAIVAGRQYQLVIRWRTEGITTPLNPNQAYGATVRLVDWPEVGQTANDYLVIPHVNGTQPWHISTARFTANRDTTQFENFLLNPAIIIENTQTGAVFVDEIRLHEVGVDGKLGPQLLRSPSFNSHLTFDQRQSSVLDHVMQAAAQHNQFIKFVISEKQEFLLNHISPSGLIDPRGGHFNSPQNSAGRYIHESYWRYLSARYGAYKSVHSWEVVNEEAPATGAHFDMVNDFAVMAGADGNPQMVATSTWATLAADVWRATEYGDIAYANFHAYVNSTGWLEPRTALTNDSALLFSRYDQYIANANLSKPVIWGEMGIDGNRGSDHEHPDIARDVNGVWLHKLTWARTGGGGIYPIYWYTDNIHRFNLYPLLSNWQRFMRDVPLNKGRYVDAAAVSNNSNIMVLGQKDTQGGRAHLWLTNTQHTWRNVVDNRPLSDQSATILISMNAANRNYNLDWYKTTTGQRISTERIQANANGVVVINVNQLTTDIALKLLDDD